MWHLLDRIAPVCAAEQWIASPAACENGNSSIFTFTMFAVSFVARLADAFVGLHGVLADGVDAAVVKPLCTLVHIYTRKNTHEAFIFILFYPCSLYPEFYT